MRRRRRGDLGSSRIAESGTATLELVVGLVLLMPLALLAVNICTLCLGSFVNDQACREAARAAAQQTSIGPATEVARAVVKSFGLAQGAIKSPTVTGVQFTYFDSAEGDPVELGDLDKDNLGQAPTVTVTTRMTIRTPAPILFSKGKLTNRSVLMSSYTFPLLSGVDPNPDDENDFGGGDENDPGDDPNDDDPPDDPDE
jgi:Flp pilus assembly protein TadG